MDLNKLKSQLQGAVPAELYKIEPGQIVLFTPNDGLDQRTTIKLSALFQYFRKLYKYNNVNINIIPTNNELLIGYLVGRNSQEIGIPYKIAISNWDTLAGFAAEYFGEDIKKIIERVPSSGVGMTTRISISETELPIIISLDPKDSPESESQIGSSDFFDSPVELLQARPEPGTKEEKDLIKKEEAKQEALLRECYVLDVNLDIDKVQKKVNAAINDPTDYKLDIKAQFRKDGTRRICDFCNIYVADDEKHILNLTAAEKAVYLTFLLYGEKGIRVVETFWDFRETCKKIYWGMPYNERCDTTAGGMTDDGKADVEVYLSTLRTYLSTIRTKVGKMVLNPKTAIEFAIEGYKDEAFSIRRSTPEIRAQIKEWFRL